MKTGGGGQWVPASPAQLQGLLTGYEVIELIGRGGMGAVYHARQISLDRPVAIKILPPAFWHEEQDYAERFRHEARLMARLSHPGMIAVHDFGSMPDGQLYFIMEFVRGTDVAQMLLKERKLAPLHALAIAAHVCDALDYAHQHGVIHRDIKPANVMVDQEGRVKVADFGLARLAAQESAAASSTMTMGTPDYVAPEVLVMGVTVDARADLYSLGVMLDEMITGSVPSGAFVPPSQKVPGLDPRFDKIVLRALQHDPARRYQSAAEFRADLDRIVSTPMEKPRPAAARSRPPQPQSHASLPEPLARGIPWSLVAAGVAVAIAAVALIYWKPADSSASHAVVAETAPSTPLAEPPTAVVPAVENKTPVSAPPTVPPPAPVVASPATPSPAKPPAPPAPPVVVATSKPAVSPPPSATTPSPAPESEAVKRLRELETSFQAALDREVTKVSEAAQADIAAKYVVALDHAQATAWAMGRTPEAQAIAEEKKRVESHQPLTNDDTGIPESLRTLRVAYRRSKAKVEEDRIKSATGLYDRYLDVLAALQLDLTRAGKLEDAVRVTDKRREVALAAAHVAH